VIFDHLVSISDLWFFVFLFFPKQTGKNISKQANLISSIGKLLKKILQMQVKEHRVIFKTSEIQWD